MCREKWIKQYNLQQLGTFSAVIRDSVPIAGLQNVCVCFAQLDHGINQRGEFFPLNILKTDRDADGSVKHETESKCEMKYR